MKLCWMFRKLAGWWLEDAAAAPRLVRRHLARCASCREALESERQLAEHLARAARDQEQQLPPAVRARIAAGLRLKPEAEAFGFGSVRWKWGWAAGLAGVVLLAVVLHRAWFAAPPMAEQVAVGPGNDMPWLELAQLDVSSTGSALVEDLGRALQQPLEGEMRLALEDSRRLLASMVGSVVPEPLAEPVLVRLREP